MEHYLEAEERPADSVAEGLPRRSAVRRHRRVLAALQPRRHDRAHRPAPAAAGTRIARPIGTDADARRRRPPGAFLECARRGGRRVRARAAAQRDCACGFTEIVFEYEPVAAAYSYEQTLDRDELILIGDFGGGTSDFSDPAGGADRAAPRTHARGHRRHRRRRAWPAMRSTSKSSDKLVAPRLGLGSEYSRRRTSSCRFRAGPTNASNAGIICRS